ncbi:MAG: GH92 family glycosyl hydrolase [Proteobacteria bacterium]|nr:GH92 family glycosyl hydrolase [Pseudomonadota bacterium]
MLRLIPLALALSLVACKAKDADANDPIEPYDPTELVDVFIGSDTVGVNFGAVSPAATRPFGMVTVGPDTRGPLGSPPFSFSGYFYADDHISAFSHTHSQGMGVVDFGAVGLMPKDGWDPAYTTDDGRESEFSHEQEWGAPGTYAVDLPEEQAHVEIAAHERSALHRYTFESGADPVVVLDLGHFIGNVEILEANATLDGASLTGFQLVKGSYSGRYGGHQTHFAMEFSPEPVASGGWTDPTAPVDDLATVSGTMSGLYLTFPEGTTEVLAKVAISYVDTDGALANLEAEQSDWDMDAALEASVESWREEMGNVRVRGGTDDERVIFHSALYRAYHMPMIHSDVDGRYRGMDDAIHSVDYTMYSTFSLWDTFRTQHPWLILARPDRQVDMANSLVQMAKDGGSLPRWPMTHGYTGGMVGTPADQVFAETWLKGLQTGWDVDGAWVAAEKQSTEAMPDASRGGIEGYLERGYVSWEDVSGGPAALTLEYAWNDAAMYGWGTAMGKDDAEQFETMRHSWKNLWDPETQFLQGRHDDGSFTVANEPVDWFDAYVEGNAWHYLWGAPQDVQGMIDVQHDGSTEAWVARMREFWDDTDSFDQELYPDPYYWHGNEPDLHYAFLPAMVGDLELTSEASRYVMSTRYSTLPSGIDGNDDSGTLSAWYLFAASGFYPIAGTTTYAVGSPLFSRVEIDRTGDEMWVMSAPGHSDGGTVVLSALLDDEEQGGTFDHAEFDAAGELVLEMPVD